VIGVKVKYMGDQARVFVPDFGLFFAKEGFEDKRHKNVRVVSREVGEALIATGQYVEVKEDKAEGE
jgi:hypothetical protein